MGEIADQIIDRLIDSWGFKPRRRSTWQSGSGNYMWRDGNGNLIDMWDMSEEYLMNCIEMTHKKGNPGKRKQLLHVLRMKQGAQYVKK